MNLVIIAALIAVCSAAKLDRTYLPPASAKTAGGSPGALQAPRNSFNNGLGGLPKGGFENEFEGVVVDAAAAGTRAAEGAETGLGAPRVSYGSTDSKVGAAAFKTRPSAFQSPQNNPAQGFEGSQGSFYNGGGFNRPQNAFSGNSQGFQSQGFDNQNAGNQQGFSNPERARASIDRQATVLRYENEVGPENYHYAFETDNGITAEESAVATNGVQAQGGFSYTGDDGQVYSISYTADEGGYQPKGDHLPTPPPIPVEILRSLEQNARDEAAGVIDDGSYDAQKYNAGSDYNDSENGNGKYTHQSSKFGTDAEVDASGTFIDKTEDNRKQTSSENGFKRQGALNNGQVVNRFTAQNYPSSGINDISNEKGLNAQTQTSAGFSSQVQQNSESEFPDKEKANIKFQQASITSQDQNTNFGASTSASAQFNTNGEQTTTFGNRNQYLPPKETNGRPYNKRPENRPQTNRAQNNKPTKSTFAQINQESSHNEDISYVPLNQQDLQSESRPQQTITSFGQPVSSPQNSFSTVEAQKIPSSNRPSNGRRPSNGNSFSQKQSSQIGNAFKTNEYLPPKPVNQGRRPSGRLQATSQFSQDSSDIHTEDSHDLPSTLPSSPTFEARPQQTNAYRRPQTLRPTQSSNRYQSQSNSGFSSQKATSQPATELTTPFETSEDNPESKNQATDTSSTKRPLNGRPIQPSFITDNSKASQNSFVSQTRPRPFGKKPSPAYPTEASAGLNQNAQFGTQPAQSYVQSSDAQYASSTQRPTYTQQPQGLDDSYIYNQPSKLFNTPQSSRFPSAPSNQFDRLTKQQIFAQSQIANTPQTNNLPDAPKSPSPSTVAPNKPTFSSQGQVDNNNRGSTKYPRPPTLTTGVPASSIQSQYQSNVNGITQASISPFPPQSPTQSSQSEFGSRPSQQAQFSPTTKPSSQNRRPSQSSFNQQTSSFNSQAPGSTNQYQEQNIEQQQDKTDVVNKQPVSSQQYNGEIYEYNKPAQTLPPPDSTPASSTPQGLGQFGQKQPQFGQTNDEDDQRPSQFGVPKPQHGSQRPKPQYSVENEQNKKENKPYGALAQIMFVTQQNSQFGQPGQQFNQISSFGQDYNNSEDTKEPLSDTTETGNESPEAEVSAPQGPKKPFGLVSACCKDDDGQQYNTSQNQFGQAYNGAQRPTNDFNGRGEVFGGPRQPPSFDEETGYHY